MFIDWWGHRETKPNTALCMTSNDFQFAKKNISIEDYKGQVNVWYISNGKEVFLLGQTSFGCYISQKYSYLNKIIN